MGEPCTSSFYFICQTELSLSPKDAESALLPAAIWPFTKASGVEDISVNKVQTDGFNIGYDPRWTPIGLPGSAIFSGNLLSEDSYVQVAAQEQLATDSISILAWILIEGPIKRNMVLFDFRDSPGSNNLNIMLRNGMLQVVTTDLDNNITQFRTPGKQFYCL